MNFDRIGKYEIVGKLGQGAMGLVFKAYDPILNRHVAIKTMSAESGADEDLRKRFQREAQSAAGLNHPNIITVFDFGEENGRAYMAMELLEGTDLKNLIGNPVITLDEKLSVMEQICDGLAFAHEMHVVHRDLKPANIHILPNGQVKIMDFGLARLGSSDITKTGMVMGTPNYMSPEQVRGERVDVRSDIFSIGAVFYELLTVHKPFQADSMHAVLFQVLENDPEPARRWVPNLPPVLVELVERALSKDPAERYQNAGEMLDAVREARHSIPPDVASTTMAPADRTAPTLAADRPRSDPGSGSGSGRSGASVSRRSRTALGSRTSAAPARTVQPADLPRTLLGQAPTQLDAAGRSGRSRGVQPGGPVAGGRSPFVYAAAALGLLIVAGGAAWMLIPHGSGKDGGDVRPQLGALKTQLLASQIQLAQKALEDKDYRNAQTHAEEALKLDPTNSDAQQLGDRAKRALGELEATARAAREALDGGDYAGAARGLEKLLSLDPNHPAAADLSARLNRHFRSQAEEARRTARSAQTSADRARARSLPDYAGAAALLKEGESSFAREEFAVAARKWLDARDGFERARRAASEEKSSPTTTVPATTFPTPPPTTQAPVTQPPITQPPVTAPPQTAPPVTQPPPPVNEEPAIRRTVNEYGRAIEQKDLALFRRLKPSLTADEERRLKEAFEASASDSVRIEVKDVRISGNRATVHLVRQDTIGGRLQTIQQTLVLVKSAGGWTIQEIGR
jgi:serine/threonine protein kinase